MLFFRWKVTVEVLTFRSYDLDVSGCPNMWDRQAYLDVDLVSAEHDRNIFTDTLKIAMPVGNVFIRDAGRDIKHDDATLALDIVAIAETTKLFLAGGIPHIEHDRAKVGGEG
jgi:hypothetical protein